MDLYYRGGLKFDTEGLKNAMRKAHQRIQNGEFATESGECATEWTGGRRSGGGRLQRLRDAAATHPVQPVGDQLRDMMSWILQTKPRRLPRLLLLWECCR